MTAPQGLVKQILLPQTLESWSASDDRGTITRSIGSALIAYAAGDAFGVAYEFLADRIPIDTIHLGSRKDWPQGGVSDDTLLSLLTIFAVNKSDPLASGQQFLQLLKDNLPKLRGLGPTTRAALGMELRENEKDAIAKGTLVLGNTNGGMMRTSLIGLAFNPSDGKERRKMVEQLALATHKNQKAIDCAILSSRLFSEATHSQNSKSLFELLNDELLNLANSSSELYDRITHLDEWRPTVTGTSLDPLETLCAVYWTVNHSSSAMDAYRIACELGGDTDTVGALAAGLFSARNPDNSNLFKISWLDEVLWSEITEIGTAIDTLIRLRVEG